ncbi:hypothetical protein FQS90_12605 [Enterococcus casseliflavus]|nr:hypothetical protein [Enterococcus casseliflavus]MBO1144484.1 hypothetical protein [Enterococcus casseliflavus]
MNIITQFEQKYVDLETFIDEFPDHVSESQECIFGIACVEFYVSLVLKKHDFLYYISPYNSI